MNANAVIRISWREGPMRMTEFDDVKDAAIAVLEEVNRRAQEDVVAYKFTIEQVLEELRK